VSTAVRLENLLGNAWKFSGKRLQATIEVGTIEYDGKTVFVIRDNGAGFDMAYADRLLRPFQRLHATDGFEGSGVGLATVQRIIHRHDRRIRAKGVVGQVATFSLTL